MTSSLSSSNLIFPEDKNALFFGDSITFGSNSSVPSRCWVQQLGMVRGWKITNSGVSGQTVTTGTDNPFNVTSIPTKTASNNKLFFGWGVNDCWKTHDGGQPATTTRFNTDYTACINNALGKGWSTSDIVLITGFYSINNGSFTVAQYQSFITETVTIASSLNVKVINLLTYMTNNGGAALLSDAAVHPNDLGHSVITNCININL